MDFFMAIWFLIMGIICVHRTHQLQQWFARFYESVPAAQAWKFFFDWTQTRNFIFVTRFFGVLSFINFIMLFYVAFSGQQSGIN